MSLIHLNDEIFRYFRFVNGKLQWMINKSVKDA